LFRLAIAFLSPGSGDVETLKLGRFLTELAQTYSQLEQNKEAITLY
jgi:hypothetical protein